MFVCMNYTKSTGMCRRPTRLGSNRSHLFILIRLQRLLCSLSLIRRRARDNTPRTSFHSRRCVATQSSPCSGSSSSRRSLLSIKTRRKNVQTQPLTLRWLPSIRSHPEPSTARHEEIQSQDQGITPGNNTAQCFALWGFHTVWSFKILHPSYSI